MNFEIRLLKRDDAPEFVGFMNMFYEYSGNKPESESSIIELLTKALAPTENYIVIVASQSGKLIGMISLTFGQSSYKGSCFAYADDFFVLNTSRGTGVGKALIESATRIATERKCSNILVGVGNKEAGPISFYEKCGFFDMQCKLMSLPL